MTLHEKLDYIMNNNSLKNKAYGTFNATYNQYVEIDCGFKPKKLIVIGYGKIFYDEDIDPFKFANMQNSGNPPTKNWCTLGETVDNCNLLITDTGFKFKRTYNDNLEHIYFAY